ncbi:hypothetical protein QU811_31410, partial [Escherichia coli]
LTTGTMNINAGHEITSKARIIHQIQLIRGITKVIMSTNKTVKRLKARARTVWTYSPDIFSILTLLTPYG